MSRWSQAFSAFYLHLTKQDSFVKGDDPLPSQALWERLDDTSA